jgi:hypothetical protein
VVPAGVLVVLVSLVAAQGAAAQGCLGETAAPAGPQPGGPALRFGITPGVQTGQLGTGPAPPRVPEDFDKQLAALRRLRADGSPFVLRLHRFFWSDGEAAIQRYLALADRYTAAGFLVELQLRYHPRPDQEGDIAAWTAHVRDVVRRFGANPRVVAVQVTNEVNLSFSPDSSDGSYARAREALVQGVIAAKDEVARRGLHLEVGFNWAYRSAPGSEDEFWNALRTLGGERFVRSVDWVGLDAYPGTLVPPGATDFGRGGLINAMSSFRCYLAIPGIPRTVPIHVEENGWPTGPGRDEATQVRYLDTMVRTVHELRGTYNVSDYRWFNLRDGDTQSGNFQTQYGLLRDDSSEKPAFGALRGLVAELARRGPLPETAAAAPPSPAASTAGPRLVTRCRRGVLTARIASAAGVRRVTFVLAGRRRGDTHAPFARALRSSGRKVPVVALVRRGSRTVVLARAARRC